MERRDEQKVKKYDSDHIPDTGMIKYYMDTKHKLNYHYHLEFTSKHKNQATLVTVCCPK